MDFIRYHTASLLLFILLLQLFWVNYEIKESALWSPIKSERSKRKLYDSSVQKHSVLIVLTRRFNPC